MIKYLHSITFLLILSSCATHKAPLKLTEFSLGEKVIAYSYDQNKLEAFSLDTFIELSFNQASTPIEVKNILKQNEKLPQDMETFVITKKFSISQADRFILKIRHDTGPQFVLPFITNNLNVIMPYKLMFERIHEQSGQKEKNFLVKLPTQGDYIIHFISFSAKLNNFKSNFYFGQNQTAQKSTNTDCSKDLAYNLRHCISGECKIDMTEAFTPLDKPPKNIFYHYQIKKIKNTCEIKVESNIEDSKTCQIPIEFNPLIQDCGYPLKDAQFARKLNLLNQNFFEAESSSDLLENSNMVQKLWLNDYPISLMCSKELDFQLPDLDQLMKKYCKTSPTAKENSDMLQWRAELEAKIAIKHATLNFKSLTEVRENNTNSHNEYIEQSEENKKLLNECLTKNIIATCKQLSDEFSKIDDHEHAAKVSMHACSLGHALSCQKAGLSLTQTKKRDQAQKYEIMGCNLKDSISCYNVACGYCVNAKPMEALKYFKKHLLLGAEDPMHIIFDPTIQCIRNTSEYKQFLKKTLAP